MTNRESLTLDDGASVAVVGGGPSGSFFSIFALKMAKMIDKPLNITIFDPKDFSKPGPTGCNRCGGVISELLVQTLAVEGINLPDTVVQKGINSYKLHTEKGMASIAAPLFRQRRSLPGRSCGGRFWSQRQAAELGQRWPFRICPSEDGNNGHS